VGAVLASPYPAGKLQYLIAQILQLSQTIWQVEMNIEQARMPLNVLCWALCPAGRHLACMLPPSGWHLHPSTWQNPGQDAAAGMHMSNSPQQAASYCCYAIASLCWQQTPIGQDTSLHLKLACCPHYQPEHVDW
jgi:hypothetical protein